MINSRSKWMFFNSESRKALGSKEVHYWKNILRNTLKVGLEFEMNLPDSTGTCHGKNQVCPCKYLNYKDCWKKCLSIKVCSHIVMAATCAHHQNKSCSKNKCNDCKNFKFKCLGIKCSQFYSACLDCKNYTVECDVCPIKYNDANDPIAIRKRIKKELSPSNSYGNLSKTGVHSITTDGSLLGGTGRHKGIEVITSGRRIDYNEFFQMSKKIVDLVDKNGGYVDERCSIHMHLLTSYYNSMFENVNDDWRHSRINELERSIPEIILANFHQLCRRYQNAITWMSIGLNDIEHLTRWEKYRVSILHISPALRDMKHVRDKVFRESNATKYGWVNYQYTTFDYNGDVDQFHVELRALDGMMCPSAVAALACLFYSIAIKAVEISRYGLLKMSTDGWFQQASKIKHELLNNYPADWDSDRFSNTSNLYKYYNILTAESLELIQQVKHSLMKIGPAYEILEKLATQPIALRRVEGKSWKDIEAELAVQENPDELLGSAIDELIDLRIVSSCTNLEEWLIEINNYLSKNTFTHISQVLLKDDIEEYVKNLSLEGSCIWSQKLGSVVKV